MPDTADTVICEINDRVATVTLNRAPVNAISAEWIDMFGSHLERLSARADWNVVSVETSRRTLPTR